QQVRVGGLAMGKAGRSRAKAEPELGGRARFDAQAVPRGRLRSGPRGVDRGVAVGDVVVDAVLRVGGRRVRAEDPWAVRLVLAEQELGTAPVGPGSYVELALTERRMRGADP